MEGMVRLAPAVLILCALLPAAPSAGDPPGQPPASIIVPLDASPERVLEEARRSLVHSVPALADAELVLEDRRESLSGTHYRFRQWIDGLPVHGGELVLSIGRDGHVRRHHASVAVAREPGTWRSDLLEEIRRRNPRLRAVRITDRVRSYRNVAGTARPIETLTVEDAPFRFSLWEVDASTGVVMSISPRYASVTGRVFPSNPVTTLNDGTIRDHADSASAVPSRSYLEADLSGLDTEGELEGPHVRLVDIESPFTSRARIEAGLSFDRERDEFEEVNAYHHVDESQRYLQALGYSGARRIIPQSVRIDVHANRGADNSYYTSTSAGPTLLFGDGGVDDAEDPDIILHEYGHAIHDSISPGLLFGGSDSQGRAISEGFGDYWAFSSGFAASVGSGRDPYCIGDWDARCDGDGCAYPPDADCLRRVDSDLTTDDFISSTASGTEHANGRIWATFLRDLFEAAIARHGAAEGRAVADKLAIESMFGLPSQPRFEHLVETMIEADDSLFGSVHLRTICTAARSRKFDVPPVCRPAMRGGTIVYTGRESMRIEPGGGVVERGVVLDSDAVVERIIVPLEFTAAPPADLRISLIAPDGTTVILKESGATLSRSVRIGWNRLPAEPLDEVEGRPNPGVWILRLSSPSSPVTLAGWSIHFQLAGAAKVDVREHVAGSRMVAAVAHTSGAQGTFFVTDLAIANGGGSGELTLIYTPSGEDGASNYSAIRLALPAAGSLQVDDLVASLFDREGTGSLEIRDAGPEVTISTRTYNRGPAGTFGQTIPTVAASARTGQRLILTQVRRNLEYRTNLGLVETAGRSSEAVVTLRDHDGVAVGSIVVALEPFTHQQIPIGTFATVTELDAGWAEVVVTGVEGAVAAYTSIVDNRTGDSVFVPALPPPAARRALIIPAAARVEGALETHWRTDLWIVNSTREQETVEMTFYDSDGMSRDAELNVGAQSSLLLDDVIGKWFAAEGTGWILVRDTVASISTRTWTDHPAGSYGQFIGAVPLEASAAESDIVVVPSTVVNQSFRTNVGVTEVAGFEATLRIDVLNRSGVVKCSVPLVLAPRQHWQSPVTGLGCGPIDGGHIKVHHLQGDGRVVAYASIVDQKTGDPSYIRAE